MRRSLDWLYVSVTALFFVVLVPYHIGRCGTHWHFNAAAVPEPIVGPVPGHHPDGSPINPIDLELERSGRAAPFYHTAYAVLAVALPLLALTTFWHYRVLRANTTLKAVVRSIDDLPPAERPRALAELRRRHPEYFW